MVSLDQAKAIWGRDLGQLVQSSGDSSAGVWVVAILLCATVVLSPVGIWLIVRLRKNASVSEHNDRIMSDFAAFVANADAVWAYPVMINTMLRQPGARSAPGLFLISLATEEKPPFTHQQMVELLSDFPEQLADELTADEQYQPHRRRRLPDSVTRGAAVYACDLMVDPRLLIGHHISDDAPFIPCLADRGDHGRLIVMPSWYVQGEPCFTDEQRKLATRSLQMLLLTAEKLRQINGR
jgi:hypothetical protein